MSFARKHGAALLAAACLTTGAGVGGALVATLSDGGRALPTELVAQTTVKGPKGDPGPRGPAGPTGPRGANGATGPAGPRGASGPAGPRGADGAAGPTGATGAAGANGAQGVQGIQGPAGANGTNGVLATSYAYLYNTGFQSISSASDDVDFPGTNRVLSSGMTYSNGVLTVGTAGTYEVEFSINYLAGQAQIGLYLDGTLRPETLIGVDHSTGSDTDSNVTNCSGCVVDGSTFWDNLPTHGHAILVLSAGAQLSVRVPTGSGSSLSTTGGSGSDVNASLLVKRLA